MLHGVPLVHLEIIVPDVSTVIEVRGNELTVVRKLYVKEVEIGISVLSLLCTFGAFAEGSLGTRQSEKNREERYETAYAS